MEKIYKRRQSSGLKAWLCDGNDSRATGSPSSRQLLSDLIRAHIQHTGQGLARVKHTHQDEITQADLQDPLLLIHVYLADRGVNHETRELLSDLTRAQVVIQANYVPTSEITRGLDFLHYEK